MDVSIINRETDVKSFNKSIKTYIKILMAVKPSQIDFLYARNIPTCLFQHLCDKIVTNIENKGQLDEKQAKEAKQSKIFFKSIFNYMTMLNIKEDVEKGRKFVSIVAIQKLILEYIQYEKYFAQITMKKYLKYAKKYKELAKKLKYVFQQPRQKSQSSLYSRQKVDANKMDIENQRIQKQEKQIQEKFVSVFGPLSKNQQNQMHLNVLYLQCATYREKVWFIKNYFQQIISQGTVQEQLKNVQLMCLILLQQLKTQRPPQKSQAYLLLTSIKTFKTKQTSSLLKQLTLLYSLSCPKISFTSCLVSSITSLQDQPLQLLQFLLKSYSKTHTKADKPYLKIALMTTIYAHHQMKMVRTVNRKLQLEKLFQNRDLIQNIYNVDILSYLIQLVWVGKELSIVSEVMRKAQRDGDILGLVSGKDLEKFIKEFVIKIGLIQQAQQVTVDLSQSQLLQLQYQLISRLQLLSPLKLSSLFEPQLFRYLLTSDSPRLPSYLETLTEYSKLSITTQLPEKQIKFLLILLFFSIYQSNKKQALIAYLLIGDKIQQQKIENCIKNNWQQFSNISRQLFQCIYGYETVQILAEGYRGLYDQYLNQWVQKSQNYIYTWPQGRKDKVLIGKRIKFVNYMIKNFIQ